MLTQFSNAHSLPITIISKLCCINHHALTLNFCDIDMYRKLNFKQPCNIIIMSHASVTPMIRNIQQRIPSPSVTLSVPMYTRLVMNTKPSPPNLTIMCVHVQLASKHYASTSNTTANNYCLELIVCGGMWCCQAAMF